ncbi:acetyltransferase [Devosia psychrophila]|uniref:PglD N-terminal domain-containing protein n=1 Tax=Devosia psychrophila TaxID=728005 RepID=A0A0F5Q4G4_9HYPH|nr:acetyltransferase [Devosia psychrophila]KKC34959.1 hypothetical protein WH91_00075 [Devosia psychrophila]SFD46222.1 hypothetical protein SAMN04488059_1693 [Devosia psychrophila]
MRFAIYGTGGMGREVAPIAADQLVAEEISYLSDDRPDIVFVDDSENAPTVCNGLPVISFRQLQSSEHRTRKIIAAVGDGRIRKKIEDRCIAADLQIASLTAKTARIFGGVAVGAGSVLCDFTTVTSNIKIGKSFQANVYSYVMHDCVIGDYVTFAPRVCCNGNVHIGDFAYVGAGAMFIQGTRDRPLIIGEGAVVGMGAVVLKSVAPYTVVVGNPARLVKTLHRPD